MCASVPLYITLTCQNKEDYDQNLKMCRVEETEKNDQHFHIVMLILTRLLSS